MPHYYPTELPEINNFKNEKKEEIIGILKSPILLQKEIRSIYPKYRTRVRLIAVSSPLIKSSNRQKNKLSKSEIAHIKRHLQFTSC